LAELAGSLRLDGRIHMDALQIVSLILDLLLVAAAVIAYLARPRIGGALAKGLRILLVGVMILGLAHFIETILFALLQMGQEANEVIHRLLVVAGFGFIIWGFLKMREALKW
jgi:hypothetical protein